MYNKKICYILCFLFQLFFSFVCSFVRFVSTGAGRLNFGGGRAAWRVIDTCHVYCVPQILIAYVVCHDIVSVVTHLY